MIFRILAVISLLVLFSLGFSSCYIFHSSSKYKFNDGIYTTRIFSDKEVYVLKIDDDTIAVFPVQEFKDSTAIITSQRVNYNSFQRKLRNNKISETFFRPSYDLDVMTIPIKYRPPVAGVPNQLITNFNGAMFTGYRLDAYKLTYKRTPLNIYKQTVKHTGYSAGLYAGIGSTLINATSLPDPSLAMEYEGALFIAGISANVAVENLTVGMSFGADHLLDENSHHWIYEGKPNLGFTLGLNIN
jgi:hypothetical protein